jgi:putative zinc finger/helix-turn-helix YgiT family protein
MPDSHMNKRENEAQEALCPECGTANLETVQIEETFDYGGRKELIHVTAVLPIKHCRKCDFSFEDWETTQARHRAACVTVGVQSPEEIRQIRKAYGLSQKAFARATRLGAATLNRWERGHLIQNGANDDYLYLLRFPENLDRLRRRRQRKEKPAPKRFQRLEPTVELHGQAQRFRLTAARRTISADGSGNKPEPRTAVNADTPEE